MGIINYEGTLGKFEYDDEEYRIDENGVLKYIDSKIFGYAKPKQPIGCNNFNYLFTEIINVGRLDLSEWVFEKNIIIRYIFVGLVIDTIIIHIDSCHILGKYIFNDNNNIFDCLNNIKIYTISKTVLSKCLNLEYNKDTGKNCFISKDSHITYEMLMRYRGMIFKDETKNIRYYYLEFYDANKIRYPRKNERDIFKKDKDSEDKIIKLEISK